MMLDGAHPWLARPAIRRARLWLRRWPFMTSERGAVAVEFAILALPFLFLMFTTLELAMVMLVSTTLENGLAEASRTIRVGSLQSSGQSSGQGSGAPTAASFIQSVCTNLSWLPNCAANLQVDVRTMTDFSNPSEPNPYAGGTFNSGAVQFSPGTQGSIVLARAWYPWPLFMPGFDNYLSTAGNGVVLIQAATTFKNEPY